MDSAVKKTVVVANPQSANGALRRRWPTMLKAIEGALPGCEARLTAGPGDATRLAREALQAGAELVVAVGGDGTIHEVGNGFFDGGKPIKPEAAMGLVPFGTGGDFRKTAGIPKDLDGALALLRAGERRTIDVGLLEYRRGTHAGPVESRVFINIASFGIAGLVDSIVNRSSKMLGGKLSFLLATARAALRYENQRVRLVFDGNEAEAVEQTINNVAVANGRFFGGGMMIAPRAELDDGRFDVVAVGDVAALEMAKDFGKLFKGTHLSLPKVSSWRATRVDARAVREDEDVLLDVDGEAPGALPASFTLLPRALQLVVPRG
jgi:YegS/Rv2252/BmrU family lipid kinase